MQIIKSTIGIVFAVVLTTGIIMPTLKTANTSGWTASEVAVFGLAGLGAVAGVVFSILAAFGVV